MCFIIFHMCFQNKMFKKQILIFKLKCFLSPLNPKKKNSSERDLSDLINSLQNMYIYVFIVYIILFVGLTSNYPFICYK